MYFGKKSTRQKGYDVEKTNLTNKHYKSYKAYTTIQIYNPHIPTLTTHQMYLQSVE